MKTRVKFLAGSTIGILTVLGSWTAAAASPATLQGLLENVCMATRLDEKALGSTVKVAGKVLHLTVKPLPAEMLPDINPDATSGWSLVDGDQAFLVVFAHKTVEAMVSNSCTVASTSADYEAIKTFIEKKFSAQQFVDQQQGSSRMTGYKVDLVGFDKPNYFMSIQRVEPGEGMDQGMIMLSFFDNSE
ncbi:hypothetical protein AB4Z52_13610 [Rhizobium sp. 2YAF20]|uniref:hypothetical protein n=1 Tax=Rhizobium sp. 2YAF20 TaxID=3233027 RepID=UPI003F9E5708